MSEPEAGDDFAVWVEHHGRATGSVTVGATLHANRETILGHWRATVYELLEATHRLVAGGRVPNWPAEHVNAIRAEVLAYRAEQAEGDRAAPAGDFAPDCPACGGSGIATVPHRRCVWQRRIVMHPEVGMVVTAGVLCDRDGCEAGRIARDKEGQRKDDKFRRATLSQAERFHGCDLVELLRAHEREQARLSRRDGPGLLGGDGWAALLAGIKARVAATNQPPADDADAA